jgi:hypothetical protein
VKRFLVGAGSELAEGNQKGRTLKAARDVVNGFPAGKPGSPQ